MGSIINLTGQKFDKLTVLEKFGSDNHRHALWRCVCECGNEKIVRGTHLKNEKIRSCGCLLKNKKYKHGMSRTRIYKVWEHIKFRCYNKKSCNYKNYGGRGIEICDEWKNDFYSFHNWAIKNGYRDDLTIDRINNNGNYEPSNCRWITPKEQANNRRSNTYINYNKETHTLTQWAEKLNMKPTTLLARLKKGWSIEKTLSTPIRKKD